jgi:hypothetical protein
VIRSSSILSRIAAVTALHRRAAVCTQHLGQQSPHLIVVFGNEYAGPVVCPDYRRNLF